jgi:cytochrome c5
MPSGRQIERCAMNKPVGVVARPRIASASIVLATTAGIAFLAFAAAPVISQTLRSGKDVVDAVCIECHGPGVNGAPRIGDQKAWADRAARGLTDLSRNALSGIRKMPAHGGNAGVSDAEIERAITYMVNASGGHWAEPIVRTGSGVEHTGEQVVQLVCANCHVTGVGGAPRIGDRAAWIPRAREGFDVLVRSAISGHGGMPPRGGTANLTDREIRAAIGYMLNPVPVVASAPAAPPVKADPNHQVVDGIEILFGAVSADALRKQHPRVDYEASMHGGIPGGRSYYHLNVSLFDAETHRAIPNAHVEIRIADPMMGDQVKTLEPMVVNDTVSYGNYFQLPGSKPYTIAVLIRKQGDTQASHAKFAFRR